MTVSYSITVCPTVTYMLLYWWMGYAEYLLPLSICSPDGLWLICMLTWREATDWCFIFDEIYKEHFKSHCQASGNSVPN